MFQVQRFDPRQEERSNSQSPRRKKKEKSDSDSKNKKKRRRGSGDKNIQSALGDDESSHKKQIVPATTLRVVAPETDLGTISRPKNLITALSSEAFDDLDVDIDKNSNKSNNKTSMDIGDSQKRQRHQVQQQQYQDEKGESDIFDDSFDEQLEEATGDAAENDDDDEMEIEFDPTDEIDRALQMSRPDQPIEVAAKRWGLAPFLVLNLQRDGYQHFFAIQALVIPDVIVAERNMTSKQTYDIMCAAPTGSGKTLAFVLPVLNALAHRRVRRLRALVILPSRDLAKQVHDVFERYTEGSPNNLKVGLAIGQTDFKAEQQNLIFGKPQGEEGLDGQNFSSNHENDNDNDESPTSSSHPPNSRKKKIETYKEFSHHARLRSAMDQSNVDFALDAMAESLQDDYRKGIFMKEIGSSGRDNVSNDTFLPGTEKCIPAGGISGVDVLVCTPGRLVDHLDNTPGFTLQHLRWLVIDEADRLMSQSYHGWIHRVLDGVNNGPTPTSQPCKTSKEIRLFDPITFRRTATDTDVGPKRRSIHQRIQLRKLLYSATLTKDPQKLAALQLVNPKYFNVNHLDAVRKRKQNGNSEGHEGLSGKNSLYRVPEKLKEYTVECTAEQKPIVLLALLLERLQEASRTNRTKHLIVVFTSSLESTHRLTRLLQLLWLSAGYGEPPMEFSSVLNQHQRSHLIHRCNDPNDSSVNVLVCSDGMSRGMDLESVRTVIHYDVPAMAKTYVHRCGRTARAGLDGEAIVLLKGKGQSGQFSRLRRLIANPQDRVKQAKIKLSLVRGAIPLYKQCIARLKEVLEAENRQELKHADSDISQWLPTTSNPNHDDAEIDDSSASSGEDGDDNKNNNDDEDLSTEGED